MLLCCIAPLQAAAGLFFDASAGAQEFFWTPAAINGVSYKATGLKAYNFNAGLGLTGSARRGPALTFEYKAPFERSSEQSDMMSTNKSYTEGLEKYSFGFAPDAIIYAIYPSLSEQGFVRFLLSAQFKYSKTKFYCNATVGRDFFYLGDGTVINWGNNTISGATHLQAGQSLSFRTEFDETEVMFALYSVPEKVHEFRIGYFQMDWRRPSANNQGWTIQSGGVKYPVVYDTVFSAKGFGLKWVSRDMFSPGFNGDISVKFGINPTIEQKLPLKIPQDEHLTYVDWNFGGCYNLYLTPQSGSGVFFTLGGAVRLAGFFSQKNNADTTNQNDPNAPSMRLIDKEMLYTAYLRAGMRL